uniref:Ig-like domain-containing protein n=1 Tax=Neogobius melanostomus TaxID=47308 RepID=A0A8C6S6I4_9GOBI
FLQSAPHTFKGLKSILNHTLGFFTTASPENSGLPQLVSVGVLNDLVIFHYDSETKRMVPKQEWMKRVTEDEPQYWETYTQVYLNNEQIIKAELETLMQLLNLTEGLHILQSILGCDWNNETDEVRGYYLNAFDGEELIALDWETQTWVSKQPAFVTKLMQERFGEAAYWKNCLFEFLSSVGGVVNSALLHPSPLTWLSPVAHKSSSSPVTCFASGFYPDKAKLFWTKDGEELQEDWGKIRPNHDGTFQSSVSLDLSSVPTGDWDRYSCVFQLSGVKDDLITKLDPGLIRTNGETGPLIVHLEWTEVGGGSYSLRSYGRSIQTCSTLSKSILNNGLSFFPPTCLF